MRSYLRLFSTIVCFAIFIYFVSAFNSQIFDNQLIGHHLWHNKQNAIIKNDKISIHNIWKSYQKRSSDRYKNNEYSSPPKGEPPYYLSYASGHQTKYQQISHKIINKESTNAYYEGSAQELGLNDQEVNNDFGNDSGPDSEIAVESEVFDSPSVKSNNASEAQRPRKVGKLGLNGTFGYFSSGRFNRCDKPKRLDPDPESKQTFIIPNDITYYKKCLYFESNPIRKFERKVGKLGVNGFFGYFDKGIYIECKPPKTLEKDPQFPNISFIPNYINYDPKCEYFEKNLSGFFDYLGDKRRGSGGVLNKINFFCFSVFIFGKIIKI